MNPIDFEARCESLFAVKLDKGRRWKTACAGALGIGRATLYRYFADPNQVPDDIWDKLEDLENPADAPVDDRKLVILLASALIGVQRQLDDEGFLKSYPAELQRAFNLGAAMNYSKSIANWPTDMHSLMHVARRPLHEWVPDLSWDVTDEFLTARLIVDDEISAECRVLAVNAQDPEQELIENDGYRQLLAVCRSRTDGEEIYRRWRRLVIENPVIVSMPMTILNAQLSDVDKIEKIVDAFYQNVPDSLAVGGKLPVCKITGTILRRLSNNPGKTEYHSESRNPKAIQLARQGFCDFLPYRPGVRQLKRAFRTYWCMPGKAELEVEAALKKLGWTTTIWPQMDLVDLEAVSPDGSRKLAIDVKDYLSAASLAARFTGFKEFSRTHECILVIPDYVHEQDQNFDTKFDALRASFAKSKVRLKSVRNLISELSEDAD